MSKSAQSQILMLLADGFDEAAMGTILTTLRQAGLAVSLVGLRSNRVSGAHGLTIVPNASLDRIVVVRPPVRALIVPGGTGHLARLRVDPRVNMLIQSCVNQEADLISLDAQATQMIRQMAESARKATKIIEPEAGIYMEEFARNLVHHLAGATTG
jgi:hypothetical protein